MNRKTVIWIALAFILIAAGSLIFTGVMIMNKWNFKKLSTVKYETNTYTLTERFDNILIETDTADVIIRLADDGVSKAVITENEKEKHICKTEDGVLTIKRTDTRKWYDYIQLFNFGSQKITLYLAETEYTSLSVSASTGDTEVSKEFSFENADIKCSTGHTRFYASVDSTLKIKCSTGDIKIEGIKAGALELSVTTGDIRLSDISCAKDAEIKVSTGNLRIEDSSLGTLTTEGSTGGVSLICTVASGKISIKRSTGDVKFEASDASELFVRTDTGDIKGTLLSEKIFRAVSDTGAVRVPSTLSGGLCDMKTDTGDIKITLLEK